MASQGFVLLIFLALYPQLSFGRLALYPACEQIGGTPRAGKCVCKGIDVDPYQERAATLCLSGVINLTHQGLENIVNRDKQKSCGEQSVQYSDSNPNLRCPSTWLEVIQKNKDKVGSFLGLGLNLNLTATPYEGCKDILTRKAGGEKSPSEVSTFLNQDPNVSLNADPEMWKQCFPESSTVTEEEKAATIGEYYYGMNRLKQAQISAIRALADADSFLEGENSDFWVQRNKNCWDPHFPELVQICLAQSGCANSNTKSQAVAREALEIMPAYREISMELKSLKSKECNFEGTEIPGCREELEPKIETLELIKATMETETPILKGQIVQSKILGMSVPSDEEFKEAYKKQMRANRKEIKERLDKFKHATKCLNSPANHGGECNSDEIDEILTLSPELNQIDVEKYKTLEGRSQGNNVNVLMGRAQCMHGIRNDIQKGDDLLVKTSTDAVLTVASFGLGSAINGAKIINTTGKILHVAAKTKSTYDKINGVYDSCSTHLDSILPVVTEPKSCMGNFEENRAMAKKDFLSCTVSSLMAGYSGAKDLAPRLASSKSFIGRASKLITDFEAKKKIIKLDVARYFSKNITKREVDLASQALDKALKTEQVRSLYMSIVSQEQSTGPMSEDTRKALEIKKTELLNEIRARVKTEDPDLSVSDQINLSQGIFNGLIGQPVNPAI